MLAVCVRSAACIRNSLKMCFLFYNPYLSLVKTSRFYIGLAVGLPVFSNISIILTHV